MKTKLVYVIVSDENDFYLEQTYVSMSSARNFMTDVFIVLVMDTKTAGNLKGFRKIEAEYANEIIVVDLDPSFPAKKRSRLLKTSLRNVVDGDFLYIDSDTLVVRDLSEADSFDFSLGAVLDRHTSLDSNPFLGYISPDLDTLGVVVKDDIYHNSGVIYAKDNQETREFFKRWNEHYLEGYLSGVTADQPALARTVCETNLMSLLDETWNCQISSGLRYARNARIWHYFSSNEVYFLNNPESLMQIRKQERIPDNILSLFENPFLGFPNLCQIISGKELEFYASREFSNLRHLISRNTFVGKLIKSILRINERYYLMKKSFLKSK